MRDRITKVIFIERLCKLILITDIQVETGGKFITTLTFEGNVGNINEAKVVLEEMEIDLKIEVE